MEKPINEKYRNDDFIIKVISGEATEDEVKNLKEDVLKDDELKARYSRIAKAWSVGSLYPHTSKFNSYAAWENILPTVKRSQRKEGANMIVLNRFLRIAATWIILFFLGGLASYFLVKNSSRSMIAKEFTAPIETISPLGSRSFLQLPDKSKIWLNAGSKVIYHQDYGLETREVELIGEAFFDIETNPEKPFIVHAGDLDVKAFGTSFNVKAYPEEEVIEATLVEGKVTVEGKMREQEKFVKRLVPGQKLTFTHKSDKSEDVGSEKAVSNKISGNSIKSVVNVETNVQLEKYTSWKDNKWIIEGEYLDDLIVLLERRFNIDMVLSDQKLKNYKFSGTIRRETLEQVMEILKYSAPIKYQIEKSGVTIQLDPKREKNYQHILDKT